MLFQVLENQHGSVLILGHLVGLLLRRQQAENVQLTNAVEEAVLIISKLLFPFRAVLISG